jgi:hypothetical protein
MTFKFLKKVLTTCRYVMILSVGSLSVSGMASATLIEAIAELGDGDKYRVLFVTGTQTNQLSSDINYYNNYVSDAAATGILTKDLGLSWMAIGSTASVNAMDNTGININDDAPVTMFNLNGDVMALNGKDFWDFRIHPFLYDENGRYTRMQVWTGTNRDGTTGSNYFLGDPKGTYYGRSDRWDVAIMMGAAPTNHQYALYGASAVTAKPSVDVPAPGTVILLSLGLVGLSFARYRRQS